MNTLLRSVLFSRRESQLAARPQRWQTWAWVASVGPATDEDPSRLPKPGHFEEPGRGRQAAAAAAACGAAVWFGLVFACRGSVRYLREQGNWGQKVACVLCISVQNQNWGGGGGKGEIGYQAICCFFALSECGSRRPGFDSKRGAW